MALPPSPSSHCNIPTNAEVEVMDNKINECVRRGGPGRPAPTTQPYGSEPAHRLGIFGVSADISSSNVPGWVQRTAPASGDLTGGRGGFQFRRFQLLCFRCLSRLHPVSFHP